MDVVLELTSQILRLLRPVRGTSVDELTCRPFDAAKGVHRVLRVLDRAPGVRGRTRSNELFRVREHRSPTVTESAQCGGSLLHVDEGAVETAFVADLDEVIRKRQDPVHGREFAPAWEVGAMPGIQRFDHVGVTVADLDAAIAFFVGLGLELEGRMPMEGEFVDTVIGIPNSRSEIAMLRPPDGGAGLELSRFIRPDHTPGSPAAMSTELGLRNVAFEVDDLQAIVDRLAADGYGLVGGIGQYEDMWRMAYVRGPEGIIVALAQRIG